MGMSCISASARLSGWLIWPLKQGQFYALVGRLEEEGYLRVAIEQRGSLPPRKLLQLTDAGRAAFTTWLNTPSEPNADTQQAFLARLYFAHQLGPATLRQLLLYERHVRQAQLQALRELVRAQRPRSYASLVSQWRVHQAEASLDWFDTFDLPPAPGATCLVAILGASGVAPLAQQFVDYVRGPLGQGLLARFGFLTSGKPAVTGGRLAEPLAGRLVVYAASSLTAAFEALTAALCAAHPRLSIELTFGGSHDLAARLTAGASCDVFVPAHQEAMATVVGSGRIAAATVATLAQNQLAIVTPTFTNQPIQALGDLARPGLRLALGSEATAIGRYTQDLLAAATFDGSLRSDGPAAVLHNVVYYGETVTSVLTKVVQGEVDAGVVFRSDYQRASGAVQLAVLPLG